MKWVKRGLDDCVLRPAHRKPLHPARSPCQSRRLSIQVPAAARWGGRRCPARASRAPRSPARSAGPGSPEPPATTSHGLRRPRELTPPPQPAAPPGPARPRPRPSRPPSSSRASLVITTGLPPRAAPVVRGRPQACVGREAGNSARPRPRPGLPRPGRAPGSAPRRRRSARASPHPARSEGSSEPRRPGSGSRGASPNTPPSSLTSPGRPPVPPPPRVPAAHPPRCPGVPPQPRPPLTDPAAQALQHSDLTTVLVSRLGFCGARDGRRFGRSCRSRRCRRHGAARPLPQPYRLRSRARRSRSEA